MSNQEYISIQEAADLCDKSPQTIRRAIKSKKLDYKKKKTPQGFNYSIEKSSLAELYELELSNDQAKKVEAKQDASSGQVKDDSESSANQVEQVDSKKETKDEDVEKESEAAESKKEDAMVISSKEFKSFKDSLDSMISKHSEERQNFLRLINTLQEKIFVLENQVNLLKAPKKKWYQVWK